MFESFIDGEIFMVYKNGKVLWIENGNKKVSFSLKGLENII